MIIALSGTPGTGKSSISVLLQKRGYLIVDLNKIAIDKKFTIGTDQKRKSKIIDTDMLDRYICTNYKSEDIVFIEGHFSHLLKSSDKVIILRCHPDELRKRLEQKEWSEKKINENIEAEAIDVILCEAVEIHHKKNIFEIDTTNNTPESVLSSIVEIVKNNFKPIKKYNIGKIDWSETVLENF